MSSSNRIYTGLKNYYLEIRKLPNGKFVILSKDKAFIEYYVGYDMYPTFVEASSRLDEIKRIHNLERFDRNKSAS